MTFLVSVLIPRTGLSSSSLYSRRFPRLNVFLDIVYRVRPARIWFTVICRCVNSKLPKWIIPLQSITANFPDLLHCVQNDKTLYSCRCDIYRLLLVPLFVIGKTYYAFSSPLFFRQTHWYILPTACTEKQNVFPSKCISWVCVSSCSLLSVFGEDQEKVRNRIVYISFLSRISLYM